jgi:hypothetical protein
MSPSKLLKGEKVFVLLSISILNSLDLLKGYLFFKENVSACSCIMNKLNMVWTPILWIMV